MAFGIVTLLVAGLLAAIHLASHHALKLYVEDQLSRLSWDIALYQTSDFTISEEVGPKLRAIQGLTRVESLSFLRSKPPPEAILMVDGKPLASPWVSILSATDINLLPPEARPVATQKDGAFLALIGPEQHMGKAFLALQGSRSFSVRVYSEHKSKAPGSLVCAFEASFAWSDPRSIATLWTKSVRFRLFLTSVSFLWCRTISSCCSVSMRFLAGRSAITPIFTSRRASIFLKLCTWPELIARL